MTENNEVERLMTAFRGVLHRAYLRGRSIHNVRIERLWRDVRRDSLEYFRRIFLYLESDDLLDMDSQEDRLALYLVFQPRIQASLNRTKASWNNHKISTEGNQTPIVLFELSKTTALREGYWPTDPGDSVRDIDPEYGAGDMGITPPDDEVRSDPTAPRPDNFASAEEEQEAGIFVNGDDDLEEVAKTLSSLNLEDDEDGNGIALYLRARAALAERF